jgi:hypothetical protein
VSRSLYGGRAARVVDATVVIAIAAASIATLTPAQRDMLFVWKGTAPAFLEVARHTAWAALRVWTFWTLAAAVIAAGLLRREPRLGVLDAVLGGFCGVWAFAWIAGQWLGPLGLLRSWSLWLLLALGLAWLWRSGPRIARPSSTPGLRLALLTAALVMPTLLVLQLGSPVPPFMDILATPAAAQRILTFGRYMPFDADAYGYWHPSAQLPGLELFYALLALGSGLELAVLADSAAMMPMTALLLLATYRLGREIGGDLAGGMATLFLFATILFRVMPYMHGRVTSFVPLAIGLAFFFDERRNATRLVLAGLAFATAVASHAVMGALGMMVAGTIVVCWLLSGAGTAALAGLGVLAGAALIGAPTVAIGLQIVLPYPTLPLVQAAGAALLVWSARVLHGRTFEDRSRWLLWPLTMFVTWVLLWHPPPFLPKNHQGRFPLLVYGGGLGLALMLVLDVARRARPQARDAPHPRLAPVTLALAIAVLIEQLSNRWHRTFSDPAMRLAVHEWFYKIDYWYPWVLVFPTGFFFAWVHRRLSSRVALYAALGLLFFPWQPLADPKNVPAGGWLNPDYHQHSISEHWAYRLETGKRGYWRSSGDARWAQSRAEMDMIDVLRAEIDAGRITAATHVVHLAPRIWLWKDNLLFSVYTGINADTYLSPDHFFDPSITGSRIRPMAEVHARLASRPAYVAIHHEPVALLPGALDGYVELFNRDGVRLYRNAACAPSDAPEGIGTWEFCPDPASM